MENNLPIYNRVTYALLEAIPYEYIGKEINICIKTDEFSCLCPWTGFPDFGCIIINYTPIKIVVELKSLKLYLQTYRMVGMVHESVVNSILNDLVKIMAPKKISVDIEFGKRGGLITTVSAKYYNN